MLMSISAYSLQEAILDNGKKADGKATRSMESHSQEGDALDRHKGNEQDIWWAWEVVVLVIRLYEINFHNRPIQFDFSTISSFYLSFID